MSRKGTFSAFAQAHLESTEGQDWQTENRLFNDVISKVDVAISGFSGPDIMAQLVCAELFPSEKPGMHIECSLGPKVAPESLPIRRVICAATYAAIHAAMHPAMHACDAFIPCVLRGVLQGML